MNRRSMVGSVIASAAAFLAGVWQAAGSPRAGDLVTRPAPDTACPIVPLQPGGFEWWNENGTMEGMRCIVPIAPCEGFLLDGKGYWFFLKYGAQSVEVPKPEYAFAIDHWSQFRIVPKTIAWEFKSASVDPTLGVAATGPLAPGDVFIYTGEGPRHGAWGVVTSETEPERVDGIFAGEGGRILALRAGNLV